MIASMARRDARHNIAALLVLGAGLTAACIDGPSGPSGNGFGTLRINPVLEPGGKPEDLGLDRIHILVERRGSGETVVDTTLPYDVTSTRTYDWVIELEAPPDSMEVEAQVFADTAGMYAGGRVVALPETPAGEGTVRDVMLDYVGGGANAVRIAITPRDSVITFGDSVQYRAIGIDAQNQPVPGVVVSWSTSDPQVASISRSGWLRAPPARATLYVKATTPTNLTDSTVVTFIPVPTLARALEGDGDTSRVADTIPLAVQVLAADGLGVTGIPVTFSAPPGASVSTTMVISDDLGIARTMGTLGTVAGAYRFEAVAQALPPVPLRAVALPGLPAELAFSVQPTSTGVNQVIAPAVEVEVRDAFGNRAAASATTVSLTIETNPGNGQLLGMTTITTITGFAAFPDLRIDAAGAGYLLRATAQGLPPVVSTPFDVRAEVASVDVTPASVTFTAIGQTQQLTATARDANGAPISGVAVAWVSSDTTIATVDGLGLVQAVGSGSVTITASAAGVSGSAMVTVSQVVTEVEVSPAEVTLGERGDQAQLMAVALDANGHVVVGAMFTWASSDSSVATVDMSGLVTAVANGDCMITVATAGQSTTATVTVSAGGTGGEARSVGESGSREDGRAVRAVRRPHRIPDPPIRRSADRSPIADR